MNQCASEFRVFDLGVVTNIPIDFAADSPLFLPIKILPHQYMKNPLLTSEKPFIPALFGTVASLDDSGTETATARNRTPLGETMLDARRLEEVLKAALRKKAAGRKASVNRFEKRISINDGQTA